METMGYEITTIMVIILIAVVISVISFFSGKKLGSFMKQEDFVAEQRRLQKDVLIAESRRNEAQRELESLRQKTEKYLHFLVRLPEAVKHLNSNLSFDEVVSSIIRLTKDLVATDAIELYLFNKTSQCLDLVAAYGTNKKTSVTVRLGDGVIGEAAANKTMLSREQLANRTPDESVELAVPILFKNTLIGAIGVLGIGKIETQTGNEKRFLAMVADLAAVALQNCEYLTSAKEAAITDGLTGLYNKSYFLDRASADLQKALNYNFPLSIFMFDIDHFKNYNDKNGHVQGDNLLKELSALLKNNTRGTDTIARYGGEEFIVMLPNTEKSNAGLYAEKIRGLKASHPFAHRETQPLGCVSISGGIAAFPFDGATIEAIIKKADQALYSSKSAGRNRVAQFEQ